MVTVRNSGIGIILIGIAFGLGDILAGFDIVLENSVQLIFQLGFILMGLMAIFGDEY